IRVLAIATAMFVGAAGVALASTMLNPAPATAVIQACQLKGIGTIRIVTAARDCNTKFEIPISWNNQGPAGLAGAPGIPGAKGDKGDTGAQGQTGAAGVVTLATLVGSPCVDHTGHPGTITFTTSATDEVILRCTPGSAGSGGSPGDQPAAHLLGLTFARFDATYYTLTVSLDHPVAQDTTVTLTSADTASVVVPPTVMVPTGQSSASRDDVAIVGTAGAEITAALNGETIHATLTPN
ncbi:MAG TPA: collagen-like protein, partial [Microbacteriaceae bacterium]|nr:collagen-like protein [Microbacteriaceae bacterium]